MLLQRREFQHNNVPDYIEFHAEVAVNKFVPGSCYITPRDHRFPRFQFATEVPDRLAYNFELPNDRTLDHLIAEERRPAAGGETLDPRNSLKNVIKIKFVALAHSGRASARMRALSFG